VFEEGEGPEDFLLVTAELLWGQVQIEGARVEEGLTGTSFTREVWGKGSFGLVCCLDGVVGTGGGGLTGGGGADTRGRTIVRAGVRLVMSWVSYCNWAVRSARIVLMVCSETFWHSVSSWR